MVLEDDGLLSDADGLLFENDELMVFSDTEAEPIVEKNKWNILIVDDEEGIHTITKLVLSDFEFDNKGLNFISTYSAKEAKEILMKEDDIAVVLLDVVMETEDAGLNLAEYIRSDLRNNRIRIILRTGQPGQAPEKKVILNYDINDYKEKTELTSQKLFTSVVSSLRSYKDLSLIYSNQEGLKKVVEASSSIFKIQSIEMFTSRLLEQIQDIMGEKDQHHRVLGFAATKQGENFVILTATGEYAKFINRNLHDVFNKEIENEIVSQCTENKVTYLENGFVSYFKSEDVFENLIYIEGINGLSDFNKHLIEIFTRNIAVAFDNIYIKQEMENAEKEIIYTLGEVAEARSKETSYHVKRVAEYSYLLALKYGLPKEEADILRRASAMHDIGKLAVPDNILNKPGKLTEEEFDVMKTHANIGKDILKNSNRSIVSAGAIIAYQHHEKYNGKGYPLGLKGEEIHIYGRITAIADVFDALGSNRVYKKAWELDKILALFAEEKGNHFDPEIVELFMQNLDEILKIRDEFKDC